MIPSKVAIGDGKYCSRDCFEAIVGYRRQVRDALPGTFEDIAARSGVAIETVRDQLVGLQRRGEAHVSRLVDNPKPERTAGEPRRVLYFEAGPGNDPDMPLMARAALTYMNKKLLLEAMPGAQVDLAKRSGHTQGTTFRLVQELHAAGKCHIVRWKRAKQGAAFPVYKAGPGVDKPCNIVPYTREERDARYIAKAKRTGMLDQLRARQAANQRAAQLRKTGDRLINALFGARAPSTRGEKS